MWIVVVAICVRAHAQACACGCGVAGVVRAQWLKSNTVDWCLVFVFGVCPLEF